MDKITFHDFSYDRLQSHLEQLKSFLSKAEYKTGYKQRLAEGHCFIHAPKRKLTYGNSCTELLLSFFAQNMALTEKEVNWLFGNSFKESLEQVNLITRTNQGKYLSVFRVVPVNQYLHLIPFYRFCKPAVYLGADSLTFHRHIQVMNHPKKILDLSTGSGFQLFSLPWQGSSYEMLGLDINPNAISVANLNARWNKCSWMQFRQADVTRDLDELTEPYDLILGNLPIIPTPQNLVTRHQDVIHVDGGEDGFRLIRKVLPIIPDLMMKDASLQVILASLGSDKEPDLRDEIRNMFSKIGLIGRLVAIKKIPVELDAYYRGLGDYEEYARWMNFYKSLKKSYWYRLILRAEKIDVDKNEDILTYIELYRTDFSRPVNRERVTLENIRRDISHYLADTMLSKAPKNEFDRWVTKIEHEALKPANLRKPITQYGKELADLYPEIFSNAGSAIRFWGQVTAEFRWQPKYLERILW
ncbi:MAG: methyltransferase domain-containing protein [Candidatus Hodarchaeota archaeon]